MSKEHPDGPPPTYGESLGHQPMGFVDPSTNPGSASLLQPPYPTQNMPTPSPMPIYPPSQASRANVIIMQQPHHTVLVSEILPPVPTLVTCPSCRENIRTRVIYKAGARTHLWAILLCLFGCWPCVPIPYCTDSCKSSTHYCTHCGAYIGLGL